MKVVILSEIEQFCRDHNTNSISLQMLRDIAVQSDDKGLTIAFKAGFARCNITCIEAMAKARKEFDDDPA